MARNPPVDIQDVAGAPFSATNPLAVRLTDGAGFYIAGGGAGGGAVTVADGADVALGAQADIAWVSGSGSLIAISKAEVAKLEAIRAELAASLPLPVGAAADATLTGGTMQTKLTNGTLTVEIGNFVGSDPGRNALVVDGRLKICNGTTWDRMLSVGVDSMSNTGMQVVGAAKFNGTNFDRDRANWNTTTGDTGAKVASFAGATQTNYSAAGAMITVLCGTVSGTTPTLTAQLQWSPDAGTTWLNLGGASTAVTATGNTITFLCYPNTGTPTIGATQTVLVASPLPRTWRLNYTIGGTTPSFTITGVYVNYIL